MNKPREVSAAVIMLAGASLGLALATLYRVYRYLRVEQDDVEDIEARSRQLVEFWEGPLPPRPLATSVAIADAIEGATREMLAAPIVPATSPATDGAT